MIAGDFEAGHSDEELGKLSAVHFVRFALPARARRASPRRRWRWSPTIRATAGGPCLTPAARRRLAADLA